LSKTEQKYSEAGHRNFQVVHAKLKIISGKLKYLLQSIFSPAEQLVRYFKTTFSNISDYFYGCVLQKVLICLCLHSAD
jgi:hypothetical protein